MSKVKSKRSNSMRTIGDARRRRGREHPRDHPRDRQVGRGEGDNGETAVGVSGRHSENSDDSGSDRGSSDSSYSTIVDSVL